MRYELFSGRHIGPREADIQSMLEALGLSSLDDLVAAVVPGDIQVSEPLATPEARCEPDVMADAADKASRNKTFRSYLGMGYNGTITPPVIQRNILENPGWYTAYTPYQAEIAQGRLEALVVFQHMIQDLSGMEVANASLLDEGTAAAEAMSMCARIVRKVDGKAFFVDQDCHPQTIDVVRTRAKALDINVIVGNPADIDFETALFGILVQYPGSGGEVRDFSGLAAQAKSNKVPVVAAVDLLAMTVLTPPGEWGADIVIGSSQRFGVPMGYGGPHAAWLATTKKNVRKVPGRIIGVSRDSQGDIAYRMALGTREQHIRRAKATSNICTAQVLLAVMAGMYAVYHGPDGLKTIALGVHDKTARLAAALRNAGVNVLNTHFFDTLSVEVADAQAVIDKAAGFGINLRKISDTVVGISFDETVTDVDALEVAVAFGADILPETADNAFGAFARTSDYLTHSTFCRYRSETEMLRYLQRLQNKDLSLTHAMIPLGSCTMKLNATTEMMPVTLPGFGNMHPFAPEGQAEGYEELLDELEAWLAEITGFHAVSLQPNAGSQGEYAGLLTIRAYQQANGQAHRDVCLIPTSAHGTNPASAVMAGMKIVEVVCDDNGNIDVDDLRAKAEANAENLSALMITYPSTHGVFEETIREICQIIHDNGGQVYMDGANLNAMVGICKPGQFGADVSHLNLHKTFAIPHGGGGPGMGPIGVGEHLAPYLPGHAVVDLGTDEGAVSAAPYGSASILPISWAYIALLGPAGMRKSSQVAILNANYIAKRLAGHYPVLYTGRDGYVAHECILDLRPLKESSGITVDDVAKRLMDYGFHGPTMSWPVSGTLMVEPTESESKEEIDRFCDAMIAIRQEIAAVEAGDVPADDNVLVNAPHTQFVITADEWTHAYGRQAAAYPTAHTRMAKFWPTVSRVDNVYGDKNLVTTLP